MVITELQIHLFHQLPCLSALNLCKRLFNKDYYGFVPVYVHSLKKKGRDLGVRDRWQEIFYTAPLGMRIEADTSLVVFIQQQTMRGDLKLKNKIVEIRHR